MRGQPGFFDIDDRLKRLGDLGDQLETFRSAVDFELFRPGARSYFSGFAQGGPAEAMTGYLSEREREAGAPQAC
jgi:hypothetical protein